MNGGRNLLGLRPPFIFTSTIRNKNYFLLKSSQVLGYDRTKSVCYLVSSQVDKNVGVDKHPHTLQQECRVVHNQTTFQSHSRLPRLIYSLRRIFPVRFQDFFHLTFFLRRFHCFFSIFFHSYFPSMVTTMAKIQKI